MNFDVLRVLKKIPSNTGAILPRYMGVLTLKKVKNGQNVLKHPKTTLETIWKHTRVQ